MALVLAGAPAFATDWFTTSISTSPTGTGGSWGDTLPTLTSVQGGISFNDWANPLIFTAADDVAVVTNDATVITSVKFTALDGTEGVPEELSQYTDAKAGLTIVQTSDTEYQYYVLTPGTGWGAAGSPTNELPATAVDVRISLLKTGEDIKKIRYYVDNSLLAEVAAGSVASFQSVSYYGNCPLVASLAGNRFDNTPTAEPVVVDVPAETGKIPTEISYHRTDLASRNIDVDDAEAVKAYLTTKQANEQYGWVNTKLGIDDDAGAKIVSRDVPQTNEIAVVDFGIEYDPEKVQYVVGGETSDIPGIAIEDTKANNKKITTVDLQVLGDDGKYYTVATETVGVMETGKETETLDANEKTYDIVAIPFAAFGSDTITVATVLNTAYLTAGDMLYVLNGDKYDTYVLKNDKTWDVFGGTSYSRVRDPDAETPAPKAKVLKPGDAIWIERAKNSRIVFTGKGETSTEHKWTWDSETKPEYSLVANPTLNDFDLPAKGAKNDFGLDGDMIIVEDVDNPQQFEKVDGVWGEWQTQKVQIRTRWVSQLVFAPGGTIKAGIGFWYYNPTKTAVTINFGNNGN